MKEEGPRYFNNYVERFVSNSRRFNDLEFQYSRQMDGPKYFIRNTRLDSEQIMYGYGEYTRWKMFSHEYGNV